MAALFSQWQPRYAEHRIPTFPVKDKRPSVKGYLHLGLPASAQLAMKFTESEAFGFALGARSGITVLDVELSPTSACSQMFWTAMGQPRSSFDREVGITKLGIDTVVSGGVFGLIPGRQSIFSGVALWSRRRRWALGITTNSSPARSTI